MVNASVVEELRVTMQMQIARIIAEDMELRDNIMMVGLSMRLIECS